VAASAASEGRHFRSEQGKHQHQHPRLAHSLECVSHNGWRQLVATHHLAKPVVHRQPLQEDARRPGGDQELLPCEQEQRRGGVRSGCGAPQPLLHSSLPCCSQSCCSPLKAAGLCPLTAQPRNPCCTACCHAQSCCPPSAAASLRQLTMQPREL